MAANYVQNRRSHGELVMEQKLTFGRVQGSMV